VDARGLEEGALGRAEALADEPSPEGGPDAIERLAAERVGRRPEDLAEVLLGRLKDRCHGAVEVPRGEGPAPEKGIDGGGVELLGRCSHRNAGTTAEPVELRASEVFLELGELRFGGPPAGWRLGDEFVREAGQELLAHVPFERVANVPFLVALSGALRGLRHQLETCLERERALLDEARVRRAADLRRREARDRTLDHRPGLR